MSNDLMSSDKYVRITDKTYFVGNEQTRRYNNEWVLRRDFMHPEEIAKLREKHPNLTAIHCMISETDCNWCNPKYAQDAGDKVLKYIFDNPSVITGVHQWMRAELDNKYFTPWYYAGMTVNQSIFKISYAINSLGDNCIRTARADKEFDDMLKFFDVDPKLIERNMGRWINGIRSRRYALGCYTQKTK